MNLKGLFDEYEQKRIKPTEILKLEIDDIKCPFCNKETELFNCVASAPEIAEKGPVISLVCNDCSKFREEKRSPVFVLTRKTIDGNFELHDWNTLEKAVKEE